MRIEEWWGNLGESARQWLIANNGDAIPDAVVAAILEAGGAVEVVGSGDEAEDVPPGSYLSDDDVDWIEETANDEGADDEDDTDEDDTDDEE